jgi:RNA polymerase sigma-70 factor (ECF subfamily)
VLQEPTTDAALFARMRADDDAALGALFDRYATVVHNFVAYRIGNAYDAEDVTSNVFIDVWRARKRLELSTESAVPLLLGFAANGCKRQRRNVFRAMSAARRMTVERDTHDDSDAIASRVDAERVAIAVRDALLALPKQQRQVVELCLIGGLDMRAAAEALGVPEGTVKSRLSRARVTLRSSLSVADPMEGLS